MMTDNIKDRQDKERAALIEQLKKTPIIQIACERVGVSRATYYRWRKENSEFAKQSDAAIIEGTLRINDLAESKLMSQLNKENMTAIIFWLKHHHKDYDEAPFMTVATLSEEEIKKLSELLYNPNTFKEGQELLTSYVLTGRINEKFAQLILKMFLFQIRAEEVVVRKTEAEVMSAVILRRKTNKFKPRG